MNAIVVGAGPNGLAAAVTLARAGWTVEVREAEDTIGGGARSSELTLPGFRHDVCSAVHPMGAMSPYLRSLDLAAHGLHYRHAPLALAHPFDDGTAGTLHRSLDTTAQELGRDGRAYRSLYGPLVARWEDLATEILAPIRVPRHPLLMARFGLAALRPADAFARSTFSGARTRALFAGIAAHSILPLDRPASAAVALALTIAAHSVGWPAPVGGAQSIADALAAMLRSHGGTIRTGAPVSSLDELPAADAVLLDVTPAQVLRIAGTRLPEAYRRQLRRYRYGPGAFKMDWALSAPVPWRAEACRRAMVVHVGGTMEEIARAEHDVWNGRIPERPFVLVAQPSLFDDTRAPAGRHTLWAYCHVPHASREDMRARLEAQIERFAPGFRDVILAASALDPAALEKRNANLIGGDITGGAATLRQTIFRPVIRYEPYRTPVRGLYICSSSTPPGGGVHGMCGFHAARSVLRATGADR